MDDLSTGVDMKTQEKLISALQEAFPGDSQAALARRAGLSVQRFNNYVTGIRTMDVDAVIGCAEALGWNIRETVSAHEIETAPTPRVKAYWKKLASTVAGLLCAITFALGASPSSAAARDLQARTATEFTAMPIMSPAMQLMCARLAVLRQPAQAATGTTLAA